MSPTCRYMGRSGRARKLCGDRRGDGLTARRGAQAGQGRTARVEATDAVRVTSRVVSRADGGARYPPLGAR